MKVIFLISKINIEYNINLIIDNIEKNPNIQNLVNFINHNQQLKHNYNHNNKYLFAIHGGWGITELDIALQNDRNISKLINIPIYNIYINADIQKKNKIYSFTDIINYHVKTILELQPEGVYYFFAYCYAGTIASYIIIEMLKKNKNFKYNLVTIESFFTVKKKFEFPLEKINFNFDNNLITSNNFKEIDIISLSISDSHYKYILNLKKKLTNIKTFRINNINKHFVKMIDIKYWKEFFSYYNKDIIT